MSIDIENTISNLHNHWIDPISREIWVHSVDTVNQGEYNGEDPGVEYMMATRVIKNLQILKKLSRTKPVLIHMNITGGDWDNGMAIFDTIKLMPYKTTIISYSQASSMSGIIFQSPTKRIMLPNSHFMFHWGSISIDADARDVRSVAKLSEKQDEIMFNIYADRIMKCKGIKFKGYTFDKLKVFLKKLANEKGQVFLLAEEAVDWGLADEVLRKF